MTTTKTDDLLNRLTGIASTGSAGVSPASAFNYQSNQAKQRTLAANADKSHWAYDYLYRLTGETIGGASYTSPQSIGYAFDVVGNRTNRASGVSGILGQTNSFTANDWLASDKYDPNGNTTNSGTVNYRYDALNHLTNANNTVFITYDGDGNRASKKVGSTTNFYLLDDRNPSGYVQVLEEWTSTGTPALSRVYNYGLDLISQRQPNVSTNYFIYDGHGSTRALTDNSTNVVNVFAYDAYGILIASNGPPQTVYLYCGEQFDTDLNFYYLRARYLNPNTGRFWSMDSYEGRQNIPSSLHKYLYCQANPVNGIDPLGFHIVPPNDSNNKRLYDEAVNYLKGSQMPIVNEILNKLESSKSDYTINIYDMAARDVLHGNEFDPLSRTINWDPHSSGTWFVPDNSNDPNGPGVTKSHSPAIALIHELGHAYHYETDSNKYQTDYKTETNDDYDNVEEKNTMLIIENIVAKALGEPERFTHHGTGHDWVKDPTSRAKTFKLPRLPLQGSIIDFNGSLASIGIAF